MFGPGGRCAQCRGIRGQRGADAGERTVHENATTGEVWVITDGAAGNRRQALALARALQRPVREWTLRPRWPWSWLAPHLGPGSRATLHPDWHAPWPALAIGCGRAGAFFTRLLRRHSHGACRVLQILDPRLDPRHWDLLVVPRHDRVRGGNVLRTLGSLNPVDDAWLAGARAQWPALGELPAPRLALLLGGPRRGAPLDAAELDTLLAAAQRFRLLHGGSLMVVASRRTPAALQAQATETVAGTPGLLWWNDDDGGNPYPGVLAWADRFWVSADSVNMISEACATGRPVHAPHTDAKAGRLAAFHARLRAAGRLLDPDSEAGAPSAPLRETAALATAVCRRLGLGDAATGPAGDTDTHVAAAAPTASCRNRGGSAS